MYPFRKDSWFTSQWKIDEPSKWTEPSEGNSNLSIILIFHFLSETVNLDALGWCILFSHKYNFFFIIFLLGTKFFCTKFFCTKFFFYFLFFVILFFFVPNLISDALSSFSQDCHFFFIFIFAPNFFAPNFFIFLFFYFFIFLFFIFFVLVPSTSIIGRGLSVKSRRVVSII